MDESGGATPAEPKVLAEEKPPVFGRDPEDELPCLGAVRQFASILTKAVKIVQLYPEENPACLRAVNELSRQAAEIFSQRSSVRLVVGLTRLFFAGEAITEQDPAAESPAVRLFHDGIREVSFHRGVSEQELADFAGLFRRDSLSHRDGTDDLATLLWERGFAHITHAVIDDFLQWENENDPVPQEFGTDLFRYVDLEPFGAEDPAEIEQQATEMAAKIRSRLKQSDVELFTVSEEERGALLEELQGESEPARVLDEYVGIIFEILRLETDETDFNALLDVLSGLARDLLTEARLEEASALLRTLEDLRTRRPDLKEGMKQALETTVASAWDTPARLAVITSLDGGNPLAFETLPAFVRQAPERALGPLCLALGELQTARARRRLLEALQERARENIHPFLPFLKDGRWYLVRNIALLLGGSGNQRAMSLLSDLLRHEDFRVRREALASIERLSPREAVRFLTGTLSDASTQLRIFAARNLATRGQAATEPLLRVMMRPEFEKRDLSEIRSFHEALGYAGGGAAVLFLGRHATRRNLFRRRLVDEIRASACLALAWTESPQAVAILQGRRKDRSEIVRRAAETALTRIASRPDPAAFAEETA